MVITAPVVGKLSQQSLEQIIGTLVGGVLGYMTWLILDACEINKDGFLLSLCLSGCSAAMGFFNVVVEESLSDANMTALTFLSVVFGTTESPAGGSSVLTCSPCCTVSLSTWKHTVCMHGKTQEHGESPAPSAADLLLPAVTRVVGIIGGVLLSLLLSVLLWPKSASEQAMR